MCKFDRCDTLEIRTLDLIPHTIRTRDKVSYHCMLHSDQLVCMFWSYRRILYRESSKAVRCELIFYETRRQVILKTYEVCE